MKILSRLFKVKYFDKILLGFFIFCYLLLAYKNPFQTRSLIGNLEPGPDSLYYVYPSWRLATGRSYSMEYEGVKIEKIAPGYGLYLFPYFRLFLDIRSFYIANIVLGVLSIILFSKILYLLFNKTKYYLILMFIGLYFLVTNYYFYFIPTLAMAENPSIFVMLLALYLLFSKVSSTRVLIASLVGVLFWIIKLSNLPFGITFYTLYLIKILRVYKYKKILFKYIIGILIFLFPYFVYQKQNHLNSYVNLVNKYTIFSLNYFSNSFSFYIQTLIGKSTKFLWSNIPLFEKEVVVILLVGLIGFVKLLVNKKVSLYSFILMVILFSGLLFQSTMEVTDARYIFVLYAPLLLFGLLHLSYIFSKIGIRLSVCVSCLLIFSNLFIVYPKAFRKDPKIILLKNQVVLNIKYKENPWNYLAVQEFNSYFKDKNGSYLGTLLSPFYVDIFSNKSYRYLPISNRYQEFSSDNKNILGVLFPGDMVDIYNNLIINGKDVYISNYYLTGNLKYWGPEYDRLIKTFDTTLVHEGCLNACNIYKLSIKK